MKQRVLSTLTVIAESYEGQVYQFLEKAKIRAQDFASDGFIRTHLQKIIRGNTSAISKLNEHLVKNKLSLDKTINTISILSLDGRVVASTNNSEIGNDLSKEDCFIKGQKSTAVVESLTSSVGFSEIRVSTPMFAKETGRPMGVLINHILISELDKLLTGEYAGELGAISWGKGKGEWKTLDIYLVNRDKCMITKSIFVKDIVCKQLVDTLPINEGLTSNKETTGFYRDYRGVKVAGASMYIPSMKWVLLVEIDKNEALAPVRHLLINTVITAVIVIAIIIFLHITFVKKIVKPLQLITNATRDIARDNVEILLPAQTGDEIGLLCESFIGMSRDIKARTTALIRSEACLTEAQRIAHIGNLKWDVVKNKVYGSAEAYRLFGLTQQKSDDTYETFLNCVHPEDREFVNKSIDDALNNKKPIDIELRILLKDTTVRIVQKKFVPIVNDAGKIIQMVGTVQDITERKRAEEELNTEKNKFVAVINAMEDGLTIQDLDYNIIYQNEAIKNVFGVRLGEKCYSTYEGKNSICDACPVEMVYKDGKSHISERRVVMPSGEIVFFENIASPIKDASGKIVSSLEIVRNITGRKQAEEEIHLLQTTTLAVSASKNLHDALVAAMQKVCDVTGWVYGEAWILRPDNTVLERNHAYYSSIEGFEKFSAFTEGMTFPLGIGLPGRAWSEKQPVWVRDVTLDPNYLRIPIANEVGLKTGIAFPVTADNEVVAVIVFYNLKTEEKNERLVKLVLAVLSQIGSIIKRKQAEEALRESEERLRSILDNTPAVVYIKNLQGRFVFINRQFENLFHIKRDELKGKTPHDCFPKEIADTHLANDRKVFETKIPMEFEELATHDDGQHAYISVKFPLFDSTGDIYAVCGISTDITEHKKMEDERAKLREQLYHAQKLESVGTLAGGIAHDFNNILTAIIGYGNLLQMEMKEGSSSRDFIQKILKSAERAANLTHGLLAFSRKQVSNPSPLYLNEIIKGVESLLVRVMREDIKLKIALTDKECVVMADVGQMEQVLMNLATNARDAMPEGGFLGINTDIAEIDNEYIKTHGYGKVGRYALVAISDTGVGMDEQTKERIFEPFFTTKSVGKGTGLGLAIVYGIIKQHNGYINVYSELGKGTTFKIYLPVIESVVEKKKTELHIVHKGGTETVLIAEDEEDVRKLTKIVLEGHGYTVIEAVDGEDAVNKFRENKDKIHLLLFDVIMPNKSGRDAYDAIKEMRPGIKALFMSGYSEDIVYKKDLLGKGLNLIAKPASPTELLKKVRELLDK